jgi:hypothetical protein
MSFSWWNLDSFVLGCIGATTAYYLINWHNFHEQGFRFQWSYIGASLLFALFGGLLAVIVQASPIWSAFATGCTWTVIVSKLVPPSINAKWKGSRLNQLHRNSQWEASDTEMGRMGSGHGDSLRKRTRRSRRNQEISRSYQPSRARKKKSITDKDLHSIRSQPRQLKLWEE